MIGSFPYDMFDGHFGTIRKRAVRGTGHGAAFRIHARLRFFVLSPSDAPSGRINCLLPSGTREIATKLMKPHALEGGAVETYRWAKASGSPLQKEVVPMST